ncbi:hypothetical protein OVA03_09120 [Asticcacaulis sp. SL142]|nr:hypothetical protein [Asticcacaulis sp. SL142]WAC46878.1 hypothetical protein OVA03_09120 [Asticcacaulis sp. SL142]
MHSLTKDAPESQKTIRIGADGTGVVTLAMHSNDVVLVSLTPQ